MHANARCRLKYQCYSQVLFLTPIPTPEYRRRKKTTYFFTIATARPFKCNTSSRAFHIIQLNAGIKMYLGVSIPISTQVSRKLIQVRHNRYKAGFQLNSLGRIRDIQHNKFLTLKTVKMSAAQTTRRPSTENNSPLQHQSIDIAEVWENTILQQCDL